MTRTDGDLLRAHLAGDPHAFHELVDRHQHTLWRVARGTLRSDEDAADAVQDALVRAHQSAASCRTAGSARGWLLRILVNICLDRYRYHRARPVDPAPDEVLHQLPTPRDPIDDHDTRLDVWHALDRLPIEQRVVLVLVDMHGYPTREVARMLDVAVGTVKSRGNRGRQALAALLDQRPRTPQPVAEEL